MNDDRVETAAQLIHNELHPAGTANTCDYCRRVATEIARILGADRSDNDG